MENDIHRQPSGRRGAPWIYGPGLDLTVGCGAWTAPLLLLTYLTAQSSALAWSVAFYALALFFNYPHYMATLYRAYHREEESQKYRIFTVHITLLIVLALVLTHFWVQALPWILTLYLTGSPWHYTGQNYGLFMMFARRAGAKPSKLEGRALYLAFLASYLILFLGFHTGPTTDPLFISLGIPEGFSAIARAVLAVAFVALSGFGLRRLCKPVGWRPMLPSLVLFSTQFLWFLLPAALSALKGWQVPQSRYSTGVLALMHSAQYLWITSYYARREASTTPGQGRWRPFGYFAVLVVGGIALFVPGPWVASKLFHFDFTASFLIFTALVNIHHFILDGAIWKLRDGRIAAVLVDSQERIAQTVSGTRSALATSLRWLGTKSGTARMVRVGTATALLIWATADQAHYYLSLHRENLDDLQRAAAMDAFDTPLQTHLGNQELKAGDDSAAVAAWRQAIAANPSDPVPRNRLLRFLVEEKRTDEAYQLTRQALQYLPSDTDLLINHGILASQLGHSEEAVESWKRALILDPAQLHAHLYLADYLEKQGESAAAIPHYVVFLEEVARSGERPPAGELIPIVLRLAQCQARAGRTDPARQAYALAEKIASQSGEKKLESLASANQAELEARDGQPARALELYQHAIRLDKAGDDRSAEAADWYSYGLFLRDAGFSEDLAYACLVRSQSLWKVQSNASALQSALQAQKELKARIGNKAVTVERNLESSLDDALSLSR